MGRSTRIIWCRKCGSLDVRRSRRVGIERLMSVIGRPYRCRLCDFRFFLWVWNRQMTSATISGPEMQ